MSHLRQRTLRILGTRGVPATHGGFETFAERLALQLVERGWRVIVYCQCEGRAAMFEDRWRGIERVHIAVPVNGPTSTMLFDWRATVHAARHRGVCLTLGYNTASFCALLRLKGVRNIINMDGVEWSRAKWGPVTKLWLWLNDWAGCWLGNHLVADHPEIETRLAKRVGSKKITMIPYGADRLAHVPDDAVRALGLVPGRYMTLVARPEPENSILEIVSGFSQRLRGLNLAVLGNYHEAIEYHRAVKAAAGPEILFLGAIYDKSVMQALRFHCTAYVHGHQVGGTNPSLVEALGAGNAVFAHENRFNRWVAGAGAKYFDSSDSLALLLDRTTASELSEMRAASRTRLAEGLGWQPVLESYEALLEKLSADG